jgi:prophage regulatory protein
MATRPEITGKKTGRRLLDFQALKERGIPWSRVHLARLEAARKFPLHIDVGENLRAWFEDEIDDFLEAKAAERDAKAAERDAQAQALATDSESVPVDGTQGPPAGRRPPPPRPKRRTAEAPT